MANKQIGSLLVRITGTVSEFQKSLSQAQKVASSFSSRMTTIGSRLSIISAPLAAVAGGALKLASDFEASMNTIKARIQPADDAMKQLQTRALELGASTKFSAKQVADGMGELAAGGFDTTRILQAMPGVLDLAAAGTLAVNDAAAITISTLGQFKLGAEEAGRVADVLSLGANKGALSVQDLAESLKYAGPNAKAAGLSLEQTVAAITLLSNAGIKGSSAGTALRMGLLRMIAPTKKGAIALKELGVSTTDATGKLRPLTEIMDELQKKNADLVKIARIVGVEASSSFTYLAGQGGAALESLVTDLKSATGYSKKAGDIMMQGIGGAFEQMTGAIESAGIAVGLALEKYIVPLMNGIQRLAAAVPGLVAQFEQLPMPIQNIIVGGTAFIAILGPLILGIGFATKALVGLISAFRLGLTSIGLLVTPIGAVSLAITALAALAYTVYQNWEPLKALFGPIFEQWQNDFRNGLAVIKDAFTAWQTDFLNGLDIISTKMSSWSNDFKNGVDIIKTTFIQGKDAIIQTASEIYEGVKMWLVDKMTESFAVVGEKVAGVYTYFKELKADLLDHSPVPDIQKGVTEAFAAMGINMISITAESTANVKAKFDELATNIGTSTAKVGEHSKRFSGHINAIQNKITDIFDDKGVIKDPLQEQIEVLIKSNNVQGLRDLASQFANNSEKAKLFRDSLNEAARAVEKTDGSIGELSANGGRLSTLLSDLSGLFSEFGEKISTTFGLPSAFGKGISDFIASIFSGKSADGIGGGIAEIIGNLFGSGSNTSEKMKSVAKGFDEFFSGLFGDSSGGMGEAIATGIDGSIVYANESVAGLSDTFGAGISKAMGFGSAILDTVDAIQKLGKTTKDTVAGVTEIAGTAIGSIWGPAGAQVGNQIGAMVGNLIGGLFGGASTNPDTKAREQVQKFLEDKLGKNVVFGSDKRFNQPGWADSFNQTENAGSFAALGEGLKTFLGITEDIGPQIGAILSEYVKGNLDDARMLVSQLGIGLEDMQKGLLAQAEAGKISWHDYNVQMADLNKLYEKGRVGLGDLKGAMDAYIKSGGKGAEAVKAAQDIAIEAIEKGAKTFEEAKQKLIAEGYDPGMVNAIFDAAAQRGIKNLEQMKNASKETLGAIVGDSYALSGALAKQWDEMKSQLQEIQTTMNSIPDKTEKSFVFKVDMSEEDRQLLEELKGASTTETAPPTTTTTTRSAKVQKFASGGVVNRSTSFLNSGNPAVMGERGAEAILPLKRVGNVLGVNANGVKGGQNLTLVINAQGAGHGVEESIRKVVRDMGDDIVKRAVQTTVSMYKRGSI